MEYQLSILTFVQNYNYLRYLLAILFFGALVAIYIVLYLMNKKTPKPEGCEDLKADCDGCKDFACTNNPAHNQVKGE